MASRILSLVFLCAGMLLAQTAYIMRGDTAAIRRAVGDQGGVLHYHPALLPGDVLASVTERQRRAVEAITPVRIMVAPARMMKGQPVAGCLRADGLVDLTYGGDGWDGLGQGAAALTYSFGQMWSVWSYPESYNQQWSLDAMAKWSTVVAVDFLPGGAEFGNYNVHVAFKPDPHEDGYFYGTVAHAFYPYTGPDFPFAGDVHINDTFRWYLYPDLMYPTMLHELGHSLGLAHSPDPASVMNPYVGNVQFTADDLAAIRSMYAARYPAEPPPPPPPPECEGRDCRGDNPGALAITASAPSSVETTTVQISGMVSGGVPPYTVTWENPPYSGTSDGQNPYTALATVVAGLNTITVRVTDAAGGSASETVQVNGPTRPPR